MVTLGSIQSPTFQTFHGSGASYDDALSCRSLELALNDATSIPSSSMAEERTQNPPKQTPPRISVLVSNKSGSGEEGRPRAPSSYTTSSATQRLFPPAKSETSTSWDSGSQNKDSTVVKPEGATESSWKPPDSKASSIRLLSQDASSGRFGAGSPSSSKAATIEEKPANEVIILFCLRAQTSTRWYSHNPK